MVSSYVGECRYTPEEFIAFVYRTVRLSLPGEESRDPAFSHTDVTGAGQRCQ